MNSKIKLQSFNTELIYTAELHSSNSASLSNEQDKATFHFDILGKEISLKDFNYISDEFTLKAIEALFIFTINECSSISFKKDLIKNRNDLSPFITEGLISISRKNFSTLGNIWSKRIDPKVDVPTLITGKVSHPERPPFTPGEVLYKKYFPQIQKTISFRVVDIERDLENFHKWHNVELIYKFWELNKSKEEHRKYLEEGLSDAHSIPTILEFDNRPVGYFEFYWAKEDRLGPFFDFSDYDRGFHFLIGDFSCLGKNNVDTILKATAHYVFLNDDRTALLAGEPRSDNKKIIKYVDHLPCWRNEKEFDFPHKRAALLLCDRNIFFNLEYPWI